MFWLNLIEPNRTLRPVLSFTILIVSSLLIHLSLITSLILINQQQQLLPNNNNKQFSIQFVKCQPQNETAPNTHHSSNNNNTSSPTDTTSNNSFIKQSIIARHVTNVKSTTGRTTLVGRSLSLVAQDDNNKAVTTTTTETAPPSVGASSQEVPDFEEPIGNHTVAVGRDAQLSCKINNLGSFRTAWLRVEDKGILTIHNNVITRNYRFGLLNNDNEHNFILTIRNVQPSDKGGYMCQINSVPMKYAIGYLDVLTPPVFDESSSSNSAATGVDSNEGNGADRGGAASASAESQAPAPDGELNDSTDSSGGGGGSVATNSSSVTVRENTSATLSCRARGHPSPTITWRREDGKPILLNGISSAAAGDSDSNDLATAPTEIRDTTTLTFSSINRFNSGAYLCIASNGVQPSASKRQLLDVQYSPIVTLPQAEIAGTLGQYEARLECLVDLNPLGTYHWIKLATTTTNTDRRPIVANQEDDLWLIEHDELMLSDKYDIVMKQINSERVQMILTLRHVEKQDFSWYKCIAKNTLGLQSNFIRFYESATPPPPPPPSLQSQPSSSSSLSSSFSLSSLFRSVSGGQQQPPQKHLDDNTQLNDEQAGGVGRQQAGGASSGSNGQTRPHTRSSWVQRSTGAASSATPSQRSSLSRLELGASSSSASLLPLSPTSIIMSPSGKRHTWTAPSSQLSSLLLFLLNFYRSSSQVASLTAPLLSNISNLLSNCHLIAISLVPYIVTATVVIRDWPGL